jgi:DNA-binding NarL/FixJ family response regulator
MSRFRILIADDHPLIRKGLRSLLANEPDFEIVAEARDGKETVELAAHEHPHIAIVDIGMPTLNGIEAARQISQKFPDIQIVMLTVHSDEWHLLGALKAGARAYVLKSCVEFEAIQAVRAVSQGKAYFSPKVSRILADDYIRQLEHEQVQDSYDLLTSREREILQLLAEGRSNKDIASVLNLSTTTVICHRQHILQKLNLHSLNELILYAVRRGVISSERGAAGAN